MANIAVAKACPVDIDVLPKAITLKVRPFHADVSVSTAAAAGCIQLNLGCRFVPANR